MRTHMLGRVCSGWPRKSWCQDVALVVPRIGSFFVFFLGGRMHEAQRGSGLTDELLEVIAVFVL